MTEVLDDGKINCVEKIISVSLTIKIMAAKFESEIKSSSCKKHTSHILNNRKDAKIYAHKTSCANNNNIYSLQKMLAESHLSK